jgi:hypothetical protein
MPAWISLGGEIRYNEESLHWLADTKESDAQKRGTERKLCYVLGARYLPNCHHHHTML